MARRSAPFDAGRLRERISIRKPVDVETGSGGYERGWETREGMDNVPAEVIGLPGGREGVIAGTLQGTSIYRITIRHRDGIEARDQIRWRDMELNILAPPVDPTGRRRILQITADTSAPQRA